MEPADSAADNKMLEAVSIEPADIAADNEMLGAVSIEPADSATDNEIESVEPTNSVADNEMLETRVIEPTMEEDCAVPNDEASKSVAIGPKAPATSTQTQSTVGIRRRLPHEVDLSSSGDDTSTPLPLTPPRRHRFGAPLTRRIRAMQRAMVPDLPTSGEVLPEPVTQVTPSVRAERAPSASRARPSARAMPRPPVASWPCVSSYSYTNPYYSYVYNP